MSTGYDEEHRSPGNITAFVGVLDHQTFATEPCVALDNPAMPLGHNRLVQPGTSGQQREDGTQRNISSMVNNAQQRCQRSLRGHAAARESPNCYESCPRNQRSSLQLQALFLKTLKTSKSGCSDTPLDDMLQDMTNMSSKLDGQMAELRKHESDLSGLEAKLSRADRKLRKRCTGSGTSWTYWN